MWSDEWNEGYIAFENEDGRWDNPYHPTTKAGEDWIDGWAAAQNDYDFDNSY